MTPAKKIVVFTDLDATLLDPITYSWEPALEALDLLREINASLVLVSSKTFAEMAPINSALGFNDPFIVENGGGIVLGSRSSLGLSHIDVTCQPITMGEKGHVMIPIGVSKVALLNYLSDISEDYGIAVRSYFEMSVDEISDLTNLTYEGVLKSLDRYFDIPFLVLDNVFTNEEKLHLLAKSRGLQVVRGGRFWHLIGHHGKGYAVSLLIKGYRQKYGSITSVGLGDSPNDFPFLELVEHAVLLGGFDEATSLPGNILPTHGVRPRSKGPKGWNEAILALLSSG